MSIRKYTSARFKFKSLLQYFYTTRGPQDHATIPYTGQPTYHNIPLLKLFGCLNEIMLIQVKTGTRS